jgi:hypothetical protein
MFLNQTAKGSYVELISWGMRAAVYCSYNVPAMKISLLNVLFAFVLCLLLPPVSSYFLNKCSILECRAYSRQFIQEYPLYAIER